MNIFVDLDGVLCDFIGASMFSDEFLDLFATSGITEDDITEFNYYRLAGIDDGDWENWLYGKTDADFWANLPAYDDAADLVALVKRFDLQFKYLSHAVNSEAKIGKHSWLKNTLGESSKRLICVDAAEDKARFCTSQNDVLVDDLPSNCRAWQAAGGTAILWGRNWNANQGDDFPVANNLAELEQILEAVEHCRDLADLPPAAEPVGRKNHKPVRIDLLPPDALFELGRVFDFGADKYEPNNYRHGYAYSLSMAALLRHVFQFQAGEDNDEESGHSHLAHAAFHCLAIIQNQLDHGDRFDDRFKGGE